MLWECYEVYEERERCRNNAAFWQGMLSVAQPALSHLQSAWLKEQSRTTFLKEAEKNQRTAPAVARFSVSSSNTAGAVCSHSAGLTLKSFPSFCKLQPSWLQSSSHLLLFLKLQVAEGFFFSYHYSGIALNRSARSSQAPVCIPGILRDWSAAGKAAGLIWTKWGCLREHPFLGNPSSSRVGRLQVSTHNHQAEVGPAEWTTSWIWIRKNWTFMSPSGISWL